MEDGCSVWKGASDTAAAGNLPGHDFSDRLQNISCTTNFIVINKEEF